MMQKTPGIAEFLISVGVSIPPKIAPDVGQLNATAGTAIANMWHLKT
jgi:hypothetical protein